MRNVTFYAGKNAELYFRISSARDVGPMHSRPKREGRELSAEEVKALALSFRPTRHPGHPQGPVYTEGRCPRT